MRCTTLIFKMLSLHSPPPPSRMRPPSIGAHNEIKWLSTLMCIFHHACLFLVFFSAPLPWWIWAVPLLRHCLRVAQRAWLIDGRQWLSPPESKHFYVVSPLKVLLSLLREKTLFVYSHSDGTGWQLLLKRRRRLPLARRSVCLSLSVSRHRLSPSSPLSLIIGRLAPVLGNLVRWKWWFKMQICSPLTKKKKIWGKSSIWTALGEWNERKKGTFPLSLPKNFYKSRKVFYTGRESLFYLFIYVLIPGHSQL